MTRIAIGAGVASCILLGTWACSAPSGQDANAYTLYRSSSTDATTRIHVATFDAAEVAEYNRENCDVARGLFSGQSGVTVRYWCEKGRFRK